MNNGVECYGFRCNLAIRDITLYNIDFPDTVESRNKKFIEFFSNLKIKRVLETSYKKRKYLLIFKEELDNIVHCQIARKREISINEFNDGNIVERVEDDYPYVNIFCDLIGQKILIEVNTSVFENVDTSKKVIENVMSNYYKKMDMVLEIHPITEEHDFKKCFDDGKVYKISFELNIPNWGNAASAAKELAEDSKEMGADKLIYSLNNKNGNIVYNEGMDSFVRYVSEGSGIWKISGRDSSGEKFTVQSEMKKKKLVLESDRDRINGELDEIELTIIKDAFNKIETLERLKMNYEK